MTEILKNPVMSEHFAILAICMHLEKRTWRNARNKKTVWYKCKKIVYILYIIYVHILLLLLLVNTHFLFMFQGCKIVLTLVRILPTFHLHYYILHISVYWYTKLYQVVRIRTSKLCTPTKIWTLRIKRSMPELVSVVKLHDAQS